MSRNDISPFLIHFTKGENLDDSFENLLSIISDQVIFGNNNMIKGGYNCVCFSEAPINNLSDGLVNENSYSKYSPFGILVEKNWLFAQGGRPAIYQTEEEYALLDRQQKWRHVTYDPLADPPINFTWEREWRIRIDKLHIDPYNASIVVPSDQWANAFISWYDHASNRRDEWDIWAYKLIFEDDQIAELFCDNQQVEPQWTILTIAES